MAGRMVSSGGDKGEERKPRTLSGKASQSASSAQSDSSATTSKTGRMTTASKIGRLVNISKISKTNAPSKAGATHVTTTTSKRNWIGALRRFAVQRWAGDTFNKANKKGAPRTVASGQSAAHSKPGEFVDARQLVSEDLVAKTLQENAGTLGVSSRPKVVDFTARAKERKRVSIRSAALRVFIAILGVAALSALIWLLFFSPMLRLEASQIRVEGANEWVSEADVRAIATRQAGRSLLLVNTSQMTSSLSDIPGVTSAKAAKHYPHGITVTIQAQRPAAMLKASEDTLTAVDAKARVLNSVDGASVSGIPVIEVNNVEEGLNSRSIQEALKILDVLPESLRTQITKVSAETQDSVTTELNGGEHVIVWGDSSNIKLKKADVDKILSDPNVIGDKTQVDVSSPNRPVLR